MPSAKMVTQKPAGSLSPESLSGHATLADCASVGELCASAETLPVQQAPSMAITYHGFLYRASFIVVPLRSHLSHATVERNHYACMTVERSANRRLREIGVNRSELPTTHRNYKRAEKVWRFDCAELRPYFTRTIDDVISIHTSLCNCARRDRSCKTVIDVSEDAF